MKPLKITVAPNGARRSRADHPALPVTTDQIVDCAVSCFDAGAHEIHLHVRDAQGGHSLDAGLYAETMAAIAAAAPSMRVQITTEAAGIYSPEEQLACLTQLRPLAASIAVREMARDEAIARKTYAVASDAGTHVQHILYSLDDLAQLRRWRFQGVVNMDQRDILIVLGTYQPATAARIESLAPFHSALNDEFPNWTVCAFGSTENAVLGKAIELGGHVRVGFENNIQRPDGDRARDNAENVARVRALAQARGRALHSYGTQKPGFMSTHSTAAC